MKTYKELERAKRDKIRQLSVDEAEKYIDSLNKEIAQSLGNIDNGFNIDTDTMLKNTELCNEAEEILNDKYKMDLMIAASRSNALANKHVSDMDDIKKLILETSLHGFISTYWQTSHNILILTQFLNLLYEYYWISPADIEKYVDITNTTEDDKDNVILALEDIPVYAMYRKHYMDSVEVNIKHMVKIIDAEIVILKQLSKYEFKKDATPTGTYRDNFKEGMIEYQKLSQELISDYEELKKDGFKNAKEIESETLSDILDKDVDYINDMFKDSRPSYDVNNFIFIPPKIHIESMKSHPDWNDDHIDNDMDDLTGDDMDVWYAEVTNPFIK